jgi:hypothetical protein
MSTVGPAVIGSRVFARRSQQRTIGLLTASDIQHTTRKHPEVCLKIAIQKVRRQPLRVPRPQEGMSPAELFIQGAICPAQR